MIRPVWPWMFLLAACLLLRPGALSRAQLLEKPQNKDVNNKDKAAKPETKDEDLFKIDRVIENYKKYSGRKNGVLLQAKAEVKDANGKTVLLIHWSIDYDGPRFPLHILEPSLGVGLYGTTHVVLFPVDEKGITHPVRIHPPIPRFLVTPQRGSFLTVNRGEAAKGTIELPLASVEKAVRLKHPQVFSKVAPLQLYVQMCHTPSERGDPWGVDAWTGKLQTELIRVPIEKPEKK